MRQTLASKSKSSSQRRLAGSSRSNSAAAAAAAAPRPSSSIVAASAAPRQTTAMPRNKRLSTPTKPSPASKSKPTSKSPSRFYLNVTGFPFPLGPFFNRKTIRTELEKNSIWLFEQPQGLGLSNVTANVRMTVIRLEETGGLWVHAPVAPTAECVQLLKEIGAPVEHIVLPTFAYEHKCFMGEQGVSRSFFLLRVFSSEACDEKEKARKRGEKTHFFPRFLFSKTGKKLPRSLLPRLPGG
jgi:hypothetical protein